MAIGGKPHPRPRSRGHSALPRERGASSPQGLHDGILEFVRWLRARGLVVAPTEVVDALRGIAAIPEAVGDRELFEATLAGTLVKRSSDQADFRRAFAAFFLPDERGDRTDDGE